MAAGFGYEEQVDLGLWKEKGVNMENSRCTEAIDFLLYSYFQILTSEENQENIINAAIKKAYQDATRQGAFNTIVVKEFRDNPGEAKRQSDTALKQNINTLLEKKKFEDNWHRDLCDSLVTAYKEAKTKGKEKAFTYGNAQKWVNMTYKNLYIIALAFTIVKNGDGMPEWAQTVIQAAPDFHIPLDNSILEAAYKEFDGLADKRIRKSGIKQPEYRIICNAGNYLWSQIPTYDDYRNFQDSLREQINDPCPLDWECSAWLHMQKATDLLY